MSEAANWVAPLFPDEEVSCILSALLRCVSKLKKAHSNEHENHLSRKLVIELKRDPGLRDRPIQIDRELVIDDEKKDKEGRLDVRFLFSTGTRHPWPYFAVEAKRLHVTFSKGKWQSLISDYVTGYQGMPCFVTGRYSHNLNSGCMLAYVFDGDVAGARDGVSGSIASNSNTLCTMPPHKLTASQVLPGSDVWETKHNLDGREFVIFHLFSSV